VCRRAAGRRHVNAWRTHLANDRRRRLVERFGPLIFLRPQRGQIAAAAAAMGVERTTLWRDCRALREQWAAYLATPEGWRRVVTSPTTTCNEGEPYAPPNALR
jgi:hypothetical protein